MIQNLTVAESNGIVTANFDSDNCKVKIQINLSTLVRSIAPESIYPVYSLVSHVEKYVLANKERVVLNFITTNLKEVA